MVEAEQLFLYEGKASRIELFVRIVYSIAIAIVLIVYGFFAGICLFIQWFVVLILGRRSQGLSDFIKGYLEYSIWITPYYCWMTDKRPGIMPKPVGIYAKRRD